MHKVTQEQILKQRQVARQIHYHVKNGLRLVVDSNLRAHMDRKDFRNLARELRQMEQESLLDWRKNLEEELEIEMEEVKDELRTLQESLEQLKEEQFHEALLELESLRSLEHLQHVPAIDPDSIRKVVEKSLREAGIKPRKKIFK